MTPHREDIWITGIGCATALGLDVPTFSDNIFAGRSAIHDVAQFDTNDHPCGVASVLPELPCPDGYDAEAFARHDPIVRLLLWCSVNALRDADLHDRRHVGLVVAIGAEGMQQWERYEAAGATSKDRPDSDGPGAASITRDLLHFKGPSTTIAAACASGNVAFSVARQWIEMGLVDVVLAGGADLGASRLGISGFRNMGALSRRKIEPSRASRPFDRDRDGFVIGEGGAMFVLESADHARKRSARAHGRMLGYGARADAFHLTKPSSDSSHASAAIRNALADARLSPEDIDAINAHATATPLGDPFEARAIHLALGTAAKAIPVSATKSMTGHLLSASAAVEAVIALASIQRNAVPPTINLDNPDPECDLCHVPNVAQDRTVDVVLSNAFGFGGNNTALLLGRAA